MSEIEKSMKLRSKNLFIFFFGIILVSSLGPKAWAQTELPFLALESKALGDFSNDGTQFVMADYRNGQLYWIDLQGGQGESVRKVVSLKSATSDQEEQNIRVFSPRFSPQGNFIVFASFNDSDPEPKPVSLWRVNPDGSEFQSLGQTHLEPGKNPLSLFEFITLMPSGRQILFHHFDQDSQTATLASMGTSGENRASFVWQKGVVDSRWTKDSKYLAYLVQKSDSPPEKFLKENKQNNKFELWLTRSDGGQLKKSSSSLYDLFDSQGSFVSWFPGWSPVLSGKVRFIAYFGEELDERNQPYRELKIQKPQKSQAQVLYKTHGFPKGSISWSPSGQSIAFLESKFKNPHDPSIVIQGADDFKLVSALFKTKNGEILDVKNSYSVKLPRDSVLLAWDPHDENFLYLLIPQEQAQGKFYSLVRMEREKGEKQTLARNLPAHLLYSFDAARQKVVLCTEKSGCQFLSVPSGEQKILTPSFETTLAAGDNHLNNGNYLEAMKSYQTLDIERLERNLWLTVMTRRYLVTLLTGDTQKSGQIWQVITDQVDKGEIPATEYYYVAQTLDELKQHERALGIYQRILKDFPDSLESRDALLASGVVYQRTSNFRLAKNCFAHFAKLYPEDPRSVGALVDLGNSYLLSDEPALALKFYRKVIDIGGEEKHKMRAFLGKARAYEKMNRFEEAIKTYQLVLDSQEAGSLYYQKAHAALERLNKG
jgi:tetratricopeptide (TPR) repeat protein